MTSRRRTALAVAAVVAILALAIVALRLRPAELAWSAPTADVAADGPAVIDAGTPWTVSLAETMTDATVTITGPWGSTTTRVDAEFDEVTIDGAATEQSGWATLIVRSDDAMATVGVAIEPLEPVDGITPLAGPRSMTADRVHWTMVTAIPRDRYGNVVADGTPVTVLARHPDGSVEEVGTAVEFLLSAVRVYSQTLAGRTALRVDVEGATGSEVEVLEVPGPPVEVELRAPIEPLRADGRQLLEIRTDTLVDQFGNELIDGTVGVASVFGPSGRSTLRTITIDGRAEFVIEAPSSPGPLTVELAVDGVVSNALVLNFGIAVVELPVEAGRGDGVVSVRIGPILTELGGFVPDGTLATVQGDGVDVDVVVTDGMALAVVDDPDRSLDDLEVIVLGTRRAVDVP